VDGLDHQLKRELDGGETEKEAEQQRCVLGQPEA